MNVQAALKSVKTLGRCILLLASRNGEPGREEGRLSTCLKRRRPSWPTHAETALQDLGQRERNDLLRHLQIKLFAGEALDSLPTRPGLKALKWSSIEVIQPQEFLRLWIKTLKTDEL